MIDKAWSSIVEVPYCFSRSYVQFQGHTALKIVEFDPNWAFPDCNSSLNSPMAMKCCTKLETAKERCPIVFQGHPSNFKVTRYKTSLILTQIGRFWTIGRSQLSNPSDLPCYWLVSTSAPAPRGFLFAGNKMDPVRVTKITQWVIVTLNRFRYWNSFTRRGKMGVNTVVSLDCNENTCRYRMFWNKRENKHIVVGSQPCYLWNGTATSSSLAL